MMANAQAYGPFTISQRRQQRLSAAIKKDYGLEWEDERVMRAITKAMDQACKRSARMLARTARTIVAVSIKHKNLSTGKLQKSIKVGRSKYGIQGGWVVYSDAEYASFVETGRFKLSGQIARVGTMLRPTKWKTRAAEAKYKKYKREGRLDELRTEPMRFMRDARAQTKRRIKSTFERYLKAALRRG